MITLYHFYSSRTNRDRYFAIYKCSPTKILRSYIHDNPISAIKTCDSIPLRAGATSVINTSTKVASVESFEEFESAYPEYLL